MQTASHFKVSRKDIVFHSRGTRCAAWLYLPEGTASPPVVIMAHGFAAERDFALPAYAKRFVAGGMAVFLFDYRYFGASDGDPRNLVDPHRQMEDWRSALARVRTLDSVDSGRIALWGSSFSGGHVLVLSSAERGISATVSQVPFVDGLSTSLNLGTRFMVRALIEGFKDLWRRLTGQEPYYVPVVGEPGSFAVMNTPGAFAGYTALIPKNSQWENRCPARVLLSMPFYRPIRRVKSISCPVLVVLAEQDNLIPSSTVKKTVGLIPRGEMIELHAGHFDLYSGEFFERAVAAETEFLQKHLLN